MSKPFGAEPQGGTTGILNDPQPDAQAEQIHIDRMASLGKLVAGLAHEMNNPLASVLANLELAQVDVAEVIQQGASADRLEALREELRNARDAAERVRQLLHDLRVFSRADTEAPTPVDVADILDTSLRIARNAIRYRARIVKDYERVSPVLATETGLTQAFLNIVTTATATLEDGDLEGHELHVGIRNEHGQVVVEIGRTGQSRSSGPSMSPSMPPHSTRAGLSPSIPISQRLVTGFGGNLEVLEPANSGVAFRVSLPPIESHADERPAAFPAAERAAAFPAVERAAAFPAVERAAAFPAAERAAAFPAARTVRRGSVLVIVEDAMSAKAIRRALEREHEVVVASAASEAIEQVAGGHRFDVILCDLMMTNANGMDFHEQLTRLDPAQAMNVVFLTNGSPTAKARTFLQTTMNPYIEKPFDNARLRALVRQRVS